MSSSTVDLDPPTTTIEVDEDASRPMQAVPLSSARARTEQIVLTLFIGIPLLGVLAIGFVLWGHGLEWRDLVIGLVAYAITGHGITVGFHRYFTHGSFKAGRRTRIVLAIMGSVAIEGPVTRWVADHRRHHSYSDKDGDPHSPWRYGPGTWNLTKGLWHAHMGWLYDIEQSDQHRFAPDLLADEDIVRVNRLYWLWVLLSTTLPFLAGAGCAALVGDTWWVGGLTAFFWGTLVRICLLHHVTWSINSICHVFGRRPFRSRDRSTNVWWLALPSMGESWHNLHHADPTAARHGVDRFQFDTSARMIRWMEQAGLVHDVRWATPERLDARRDTRS